MKYCNQCGQLVESKIPENDNLVRFVCTQCNLVHYQNPKVVAGCIPVWNDKILLCTRAIQPRYGYWTLPAGFMENDETLEQAAMRESMEEANAKVEIEGLFSIFSLPRINQVYMMYRARLLDLDFYPGNESLAVDLFEEDKIPWDNMAFKTISVTLNQYFQDRKQGRFGVHSIDLMDNKPMLNREI